MARISSFTVFIWSTLILYTLLGGLFTAYATYGSMSSYITPIPTTIESILGNYTFSENHNLTLAAGQVDYATFSPPKKGEYKAGLPFLPDYFEIQRSGQFGALPVTFWYTQAWYYINLTAVISPTEAIILANCGNNSISQFRLDPSTSWDAIVLVYPVCNSTGGFTYGGTGATALLWSIQNDTVSVAIATNTYGAMTTFDLGIIIGTVTSVVSGFYTMGAPMEVSLILGGLWWMLLALGIAKLIIG